ncbi:hypothetical protein BKA56DRAFT_622129 [Ilyonectria sp. MPI-CAGE-AT-0026]|nr:hypothetical protein BKA56DRAFT_622129 [Ilyonectria sp. MPI-CAGE-AT-0026]
MGQATKTWKEEMAEDNARREAERAKRKQEGLETACYGYVSPIRPTKAKEGFKLMPKTIRQLQPLLPIKGLEYCIVEENTERFGLNIYGPRKDMYRAEQSCNNNKLELETPVFVRPGKEVSSWSGSDLRKMAKNGVKLPSRLRHFSTRKLTVWRQQHRSKQQYFYDLGRFWHKPTLKVEAARRREEIKREEEEE